MSTAGLPTFLLTLQILWNVYVPICPGVGLYLGASEMVWVASIGMVTNTFGGKSHTHAHAHTTHTLHEAHQSSKMNNSPQLTLARAASFHPDSKYGKTAVSLISVHFCTIAPRGHAVLLLSIFLL